MPSERGGGLAAGQVFAERYQIEALLGRGGMGAVYRARDLALGVEIALKVLPVDADAAPTAVLRFRQEVKLARRVTHPGVARVFDIGEHEGTLYLTMELIDGPTLRDALRRAGHFPIARALEIARAVCAGLEAAHTAGVVHRDLKPSNILLASSGRAVLSDFGIARDLGEESFLTTGVVGTPHYMAPEQAFGGAVDARTDIFALGLVLFELVSGERPEGAPHALAAALEARRVPAPVAWLVRRCLALSPDARPQSAGEVARLLEQIAAGVDVGEGVATVTTERATRCPTDAAIVPNEPRLPDAGRVTTGTLASCAVAVLPFAYHGARENEYFGDTLADELVDVLATIRGMRVIGTGATTKYRAARDPQVIGQDLRVGGVIDGAVQLAGERVRISVRLLDAGSREQRWSEHHEGTLSELFTFQEVIARRVAEGLRFELTTIAFGEGVPAEAVERYLAARRALRARTPSSLLEAVDGFARCIELAPTFAPAFAGHAMSCLRARFVDRSEGGDAPATLHQAASSSVRRALERAPDLAESHLAAGMFAAHSGDYAAAVRSLLRALEIAPTCAEASEFLGMLECEAGREERGIRRVRLADELNPQLLYPLFVQARVHELHGRRDACDAMLSEFHRRVGPDVGAARELYIRRAAWRGDHEALAGLLDATSHVASPAQHWATLYALTILGKRSAEEIEKLSARSAAHDEAPRKSSQLHQLVTEVHASRGDTTSALRALRRASATLIDVSWVERCPLLHPLRALPEFAEAKREIDARAAAAVHG